MVNWLRALFSPAPGLQLAPDAIPVPWPAEPAAIFERITSGERQADGSLRDATFLLPGENELGSKVSNGVSNHSYAYELEALERAQAHDVSRALCRAADDHAAPRIANMYRLVLSAPSAAVGHDLLARLERSGADPARMALLARWLAHKAPDAIAIEIAISVLGRYGSASDAALLMTLGLHEEFTQLCAIALCKLLEPEQSQTAMWNLARHVHGWGRVHVVRMLATTECPEIQQWLLRDGYKTSCMAGYLAYLCATGGKMREALQAPASDKRLLIGAGEIIVGLFDGRDGPGKTMADYADGFAATLAYLQDVQRQRPQQLRVAASVGAIAVMDSYGWNEAQLRQVKHLAKQILAMDYWPALVQDKLRFGNDDEFDVAATVARAFRVDAWEFQFAKQQRRERSQWYWLTDTTDPARVDRYVALAMEQLDLAALESADFGTHSAINWLAIGLRKFPGKGWPILRAALTGGDSANKSNALDSLARWRKEHWHADAVAVLERACHTEAHSRVRQEIEHLLLKHAVKRNRDRSGA